MIELENQGKLNFYLQRDWCR